MTKAELRKTAQMALKSEYGFAPSLDKIVLLEANLDGTYILFEVLGHEYRFDSYRESRFNTVWVGNGTITKKGANSYD